MSLPDAAAVAARAGVGANDPGALAALDVALAWARERLARASDDTLADLNASGNDAVLAMAVDVLKTPNLQNALANPDNDTAATIPFDIGRRWEAALLRGNKHLWGIR